MSRFKTPPSTIAASLACALATASFSSQASAAVILSEGPAASASDPPGNFSDDISAPTDAGTLGLGTSTIEGILYSGRSIGVNTFRFDVDAISFTVPAGLELQSIIYTGSITLSSVNPIFPDTVVDTIEVGLFGPGGLDTAALVLTGNDVVPLFSDPPAPTLGAGTYTIRLEEPVGFFQPPSAPLTYTIDLVTVPVPEPGSLALLAAGGLILAQRRRA